MKFIFEVVSLLQTIWTMKCTIV